MRTCRKIIRNAVIYTVDGDGWEKRKYTSMGIDEEGRIVYLGTEEDADRMTANCSVEAEVTDMKGRTMLPGFIDSHVHAPGTAFSDLYEIDLFSCTTREDTLDAVREYIEMHPDEDEYYGSGFNMGMRDKDGNEPCAAWLDEICPDKVIVLRSYDMHSMWTNTFTMDRVGITEESFKATDGKIHRYDDGTPTGLFTDVIGVLPKAHYTREQKNQAMKAFIKKMNTWGYTSIMSVGPLYGGMEFERYSDVEAEGELTLRVNIGGFISCDNAEQDYEKLLAQRKLIQSDLIKVSTAKYLVDGVLEGMTACLKQPYNEAAGLGKNYNGRMPWDVSSLGRQFKKANGDGLQTHSHVIGDAAVSLALDALQYAGQQMDIGKNRNVLTHLQLVDPEDYPRFGEMGIIAAVQTFWHFKEPGFFENIDEKILGERVAYEYPVKSLKDAGAVITNSGDYPVSSVNNPLWGIKAGIIRNVYNEGYYGVSIDGPDDERFVLNPQERLSLAEMIEAYTINGAYELFRENETGSLVEGKKADCVVLDRDPFETPVMELDRIKVKATIFNGNIVFESSDMECEG